MIDVLQLAKLLSQHHQTAGVQVSMGVTCACGYWTGSDEFRDSGRPRPWGKDMLDIHRARVVAEWIQGESNGNKE